MEPAEEEVLKLLDLQKPMNDAIGRGDSDVQQFYKGVTVFITGGSGFIGKQLIEKLFRSCAIEKMYLLLRPKKKIPIQERLQQILNDTVFQLVYEKNPHFADKIVPVEGDISMIRMGMNEEQRTQITKEVNVIFHVAATTKFNAPLREATFTNVLGTREALALAKECTKCKSFVHVSTAFTHATKDRVGKEFSEQFYPSPLSPDTLIQLVENVDENRLNCITQDLLYLWPNTYTFTKAIAEELIRTSAGDLPVCIVRPPIVVPAYCEPAPGWLDASTIFGPSGFILGILLGVLHVFFADLSTKLSIAPVDFVNNITIVAPWDAEKRRRKGDVNIPVYNATKNNNCCTPGFIREVLLDARSKFCSPKAVWHCYSFITKNHVRYRILTFFLHYIPAYLLDIVLDIIGKKPKNLKSFVKLYKKCDEYFAVYSFFLSSSWDFKNQNSTAMLSRMSDTDRAIFNCDIAALDMKEFVVIWALGIRKYIIKDGLKGSRAAAKWQCVYITMNYVILIAILYILWKLFAFVAM
uniref:Fatty acyl-CoA reductase n=1 Tax=Hyphantria cunea TaxID=39466 RepID=A0A5S9HEZ0_HYPCU|nr:fatty acyl-CoA reductase [Hyphantria cunea]